MTRTRLYLTIDTALPRLDALDRRDEIIAKLAELGIRLSLTDAGTYVYLSDVGVPTLGDRLTSGGRR